MSLLHDDDKIRFSEILGFWHRTAFHNIEGRYKHKTEKITSIGNKKLVKTINRWLDVEERKLFRLISVFASKTNYLSTPTMFIVNSKTNKIISSPMSFGEIMEAIK